MANRKKSWTILPSKTTRPTVIHTGPEFQCGIVGIAHNFIDSHKSSTYNARNSHTHLQWCLIMSSHCLHRCGMRDRLAGSPASDGPTSADNTLGALSLPLSTRLQAASAAAASLASIYRQVSMMWTWRPANMNRWLKHCQLININPPESQTGNGNVTNVKQQSKDKFQAKWLRIYPWLEFNSDMVYSICKMYTAADVTKRQL